MRSIAFPRKSVLAAGLGSFDGDVVTEPLEALDGAAERCPPVTLVEIVAAEVLVSGSVADDAVGNDQDRVCHSDERALVSSPSGQAAVLCGKVGVLGVRCSPSRFDQGGPQPGIARPDVTAAGPPRTLI